jgi:hypothetical protein
LTLGGAVPPRGRYGLEHMGFATTVMIIVVIIAAAVFAVALTME